MNKRILFAVLPVCALMLTLPLKAQTNYTLTVSSGAQQTFSGFGASEVQPNGTIPDPQRSQMEAAVFNTLHAKILRLWVGSDPNTSESSMKSTFYSTYVDSNVISRITAEGVTTLLLAPARGEAEPTDNLDTYAAKLAQFILDVKNERGIVINVTGVANEPQNWTPAEITSAVKYLRTELDNRGLTSVQIIAPECASGDSNCDAKLDGLHGDFTAWTDLYGIASHSYNMAATSNEASRTYGKPYWITEAADDGNETAENTSFAASIAARFLNDMNHLVTDWVFFIGFSDSTNVTTDNDSATKLMIYDQATGTIFTPLKYYYFQQLLSTFDVGSVFRATTSATEGDMAYSYGQKPAINAAAAVNPDGSWGISVVNDTGTCCNGSISQWYSATTYNVTINVSELSGSGSKTFTLYRSKANTHFVNEGSVTMTNGSITLTISPGELISLRSAGTGTAPAAPSGLTATAASSSQINLSWTDNSNNETGFNIQRKTGSGGTYGQIATVGANVTTFMNTGLAAGTTYYYQVNATNAYGTSSWSNEASAATSGGSSSGALSGTVAAAAGSYNLTTLGTTDWAHWNGTFVHKSSGGTQISNVTQNGGGTYGTYSDTSRNISWTDGTPTASGTNDHGYIWSNGTANSGWSFTVPADTSVRTLHVILGGPSGSTVKITAHLSDGSAADYTDSETGSSIFTKEYTLVYSAASASQTLTISVIHTNSGSPSADLIAAWLTGGPTITGSLSGTVTAAAGSYNLTTLGTTDWAHWNGTFIHKSSGGTQIGNVTQIGGGTYGTYSDTSRNITWTDGTPTASGTNDHGYIWSNGTANSGWTFTVPAGTTVRTLHVLLGGPSGATTKITAHLSDSSASDFTDTQTYSALATKEYTLTYNSVSSGQTLTITVIHTNSGGPSADLIAAWLP
jgi:hypothetical protein